MFGYIWPITTSPTSPNFPFLPTIPTFTEEILDQPIILNPYFYCIPPMNISGIFTIITNLFIFLQPGLISSRTSDKKLGFPSANHKVIYKLIMDLPPNNWKHLLSTETSEKLLLTTFCYSNKGTRKVKNFQNFLIKKFSSLLNLTVLNTTKIWNLFHGQTSLKDTIFSVLKSRVKLLLIG